MVELTWFRVKAKDYFGAYQQAGNMKHGDWVNVKWPNGSVTVEKLLAREGRGSAQVDMTGHPDTFPTRRFGISRAVEGVNVFVPLEGLLISRGSRPHNAMFNKKRLKREKPAVRR